MKKILVTSFDIGLWVRVEKQYGERLLCLFWRPLNDAAGEPYVEVVAIVGHETHGSAFDRFVESGSEVRFRGVSLDEIFVELERDPDGVIAGRWLSAKRGEAIRDAVFEAAVHVQRLQARSLRFVRSMTALVPDRLRVNLAG